ncbi:uncharacterized protein LOC108953663 [Musa acuminata AAA Group]|uniref:uncharacterized protein LOC108953663 n=1 Tax=Musa acuminata AAA Group TaxID=214697 RepID=UPI0031D81E33
MWSRRLRIREWGDAPRKVGGKGGGGRWRGSGYESARVRTCGRSTRSQPPTASAGEPLRSDGRDRRIGGMCRRKTRHSRRVAQRGLASRSPVTVKRQSTEERGTSFLRGNCGSENQRTSRMRLNKERNQCKYIQIRFCSSGSQLPKP